MNSLNKSISNKKRLLFGLFISFVIFLICRIGISFLLTLLALFTLGIINFSVLSITSPFLYAVIVSVPFIVVNWLVLIFSKKDSDYKKGLKFGFLFILITFLGVISSYHYVSNIQTMQQQRISDNEKVSNGDISVCNNMTEKDQFPGQVPSAKQLKDDCYQKIVNWATNSGDVSNCDRLKSNLPSFNSCVLQIAQSTHNAGICSKLNTEVLVSNCNSLANKK